MSKEFVYSEELLIPEGGYPFPADGVTRTQVIYTDEGVRLLQTMFGRESEAFIPHEAYTQFTNIIGRARAARLVATGDAAKTT